MVRIRYEVSWGVFNKGKTFPTAFFGNRRQAQWWRLTQRKAHLYEIKAMKIAYDGDYFTIYDHHYKITKK